MQTKQRAKRVLSGIALMLCLSAHADKPKSDHDDKPEHENKQDEMCFTGFDGTIHYQFSIKERDLANKETKPFQGRVFGALVPCAGLKQWPLIATKITDNDQIILAFRAMTADAASCGSIDYIVQLDESSLSGLLQLHNDRNEFSNTSTFVPAACADPPAMTAPDPREPRRENLRSGVDSHGNAVP